LRVGANINAIVEYHIINVDSHSCCSYKPHANRGANKHTTDIYRDAGYTYRLAVPYRTADCDCDCDSNPFRNPYGNALVH
jgi:hypothetical protein